MTRAKARERALKAFNVQPGESVLDSIAAALLAARDEAIEEAARLCDKAMLVPPDGGAPTTDEVRMCEVCAAAIRALKKEA